MKRNSNAQQPKASRQELLFGVIASLPLIGILLGGMCTGIISASPAVAVRHLGYGLLIGFAAYVTGGFGGFLFALPRSNSSNTQKGYFRNDNLLQISDWLTKIIVGLGLTNLHKIPANIVALGAAVAPMLSDPTPEGRVLGAVLGEGIIIYFLVSGFLGGYLWTNIEYIIILTAADETAKNIVGEKQNLENEANEQHQSGGIDSSVYLLRQKQEFETERTGASEGEGKLLNYNEFSALVTKARAKMQNGLDAQKSKDEAEKDPNKDMYGNNFADNDRLLTAIVKPFGNSSSLFKVIMQVTTTDSNKALKDGDVVLFALHHTFPDPFKIVTAKDGTASLEVISYGAFTVGVLADNGNTQLELDLATIPGAPDKFIKN